MSLNTMVKIWAMYSLCFFQGVKVYSFTIFLVSETLSFIMWMKYTPLCNSAVLISALLPQFS